jgi:hypothetical protein
VVLERSQFRKVDDIHFPSGKVMTDGCALMSPDLAVAITRCLGLDEVPSALKGRIGGAKGLWLVDKRSSFAHTDGTEDFWIEVRPSQLKIEPHPVERECDDEHRTFEVCDYSKPLRPTSLNSQIINVLYNGGVSRDTLGIHLSKLTAEYYDTLCGCLDSNDPLLVRVWLQKYHSEKCQRPDFEFIGGRPITRVDQIKTYLDVGFNRREHKPLHE